MKRKVHSVFSRQRNCHFDYYPDLDPKIRDEEFSRDHHETVYDYDSHQWVALPKILIDKRIQSLKRDN